MDAERVTKGTLFVRREDRRVLQVREVWTGHVSLSAGGAAVQWRDAEVAKELRPFWLQERDKLVGFEVAKMDPVSGTAWSGGLVQQYQGESQKRQFLNALRGKERRGA